MFGLIISVLCDLKGWTELVLSVLATISHEDYVLLQLNKTEKALLNEQGFDFWCQWWPA
ncbi:hypothetical protein [Hymenobacter lapidiphilus]|uniref:Uncharacterized protein n=1 Tax=Hymenobacter lapidiphilus TaxID=2608003 RepID=A0A7Y7U6D1_9BACT|nr:hypothetical protein [Hymenobacter lapidiphilus]NVO32383.1 hypothetical protein [Hymenobacter lapidiphilus]